MKVIAQAPVRRALPGALVTVLLLLAATLTIACGGASRPTATPGAVPGNLAGNINIDGSSTVFPITEAVAEEFGKRTGGKVRVVVGVSGTGGGFTKFCAGETDISNASRPIKAVEASACAKAGIEFIELPVAIDGLTVMVNPQNNFIQCLTVAQLKTIWGPASEGKIIRWNQVRPEWPNETIRLYGPGTDSGTFDYFTEVITGKAQASRGDFTASEDDNVLVQGIAGDRYSLGYFGYAYYQENTGRLKAAPIDGGAGCISPTEQTINDGSYKPLSRPLFIYVRKEAAAQPHIREFVRSYLDAGGQKLVVEVGYIPFASRVYELALARFEAGKTGALFGGDNPRRGTVEAVLTANP
ncbi:MAG: PstS family phosphate ABC transporter substrate-binding protein [Dehalococcoidia bacterium]|nr:PstS family phosphate ABC transporter substrate-binding protein [Dehalococcoidia bacterium]MSQ17469.1 PstS family phosphate ABC transporter substrate-binding protein [Dehalococcoidia bacterium]